MKKLVLVLALGLGLTSCEKEPLEDINTDIDKNGSTCIYKSDGSMDCEYNVEVIKED
jgi:hypothetical protein